MCSKQFVKQMISKKNRDWEDMKEDSKLNTMSYIFTSESVSEVPDVS